VTHATDARERPRQAVIFAGGRGTRLGHLTYQRPKPMIEFHGRPFLDYLVELVREQGFERVLLLLGYLPDVIIDHFGDGRGFGVDITYDVTEPEDETSYRFQHALERSLLDECFLLLYCDNYWPMRFDDMWDAFRNRDVAAQVTVYANRDGYTRDGVRVGDDDLVEVFDRDRTRPGLAGTEIGFAVVRRDDVASLLPDPSRTGAQMPFEAAVYPELVDRRRLGAYCTEHRYYSVGDQGRLSRTDHFLARHPAVILDRDGVLNVRPPRAQYVRRPEEFVWLPGALDALRHLHEAGYLVVVITNQAGVGRGEMTMDDLADVHAAMCRDAAEAGGSIDAIYFCPHDWDDGCACRKPKPGLLFQAQHDHDLDLSRTPFIGDDERDEQAARAAGCPSILVTDDRPLDRVVADLLEMSPRREPSGAMR
jgi:D-glycero-D-manno-heptose 1,7-bisphosphate phosphatase